MLPELLDIIVLLCDLDTIQNFSLSNQYFYNLISHGQWWKQKSINDQIPVVFSVSDIVDCQDHTHQHYPSSNRNHFKIKDWINYYKECQHAKIKAINTLLVHEIDLSMSPDAYIHIFFKKKALLRHGVETTICKGLTHYQLTDWTDTDIKISSNYKIEVKCKPYHLIALYNLDKKRLLDHLSEHYNDPNTIITNNLGKEYYQSHTWKVADYLGHINT